MVLNDIELFEASIPYCKKAINLVPKEINKGIPEYILQFYLAESYYNLNNLDTAILTYEENLPPARRNHDSLALSSAYNNLGIAYINKDEHDHDKAEQYLQEGLILDSCRQDTFGIVLKYTNMADLYFDKYEDDKALLYWHKALSLAPDSTDLDLTERLYDNLAFAHEEFGNSDSALFYLRKKEKLRNIRWNRDRLWELAQKEKQQAITVRENRIELLHKETELQESELKRKKLQRNSFIVASIVLICLVFLAWRSYKLKRDSNALILSQNKELEESNALKNKLFSVVGHDLRSPIRSIKRSQVKLDKALQQGAVSEAQNLVRLTNRALDQTQHLMDNMLHWGVAQQNLHHLILETADLAMLAQMVVHDYMHLIEEKEITLNMDVSNTSLVITDRHIFRTVMRNVVDNAIKYNIDKGHISIETQLCDSWAEIEIENSGPSVPQEVVERIQSKKSTPYAGAGGLGLVLCKDLMHKNSGEFGIFATSQGTKIVLRFQRNQTKTT